MRRLLLLPLLTLFGCPPSTGADDDDDDSAVGADDDDATPCEYPADANPVMTVGDPLVAYSWPSALDANRGDAPLDLEQVHCDDDPNREWSPFDVLLFVSIPAW